MTVPYDTITMENYTVGVLLLPQYSRAVAARTLTLTADVAVGDKALTATSSSANTVLKAGLSLAFKLGSNPINTQHALVLEDVVIDNITPTDILISPCKYAIQTGATARLVEGLVSLFGVQDFALQTSTTAVDTTNTRSETSTESKAVRSAKSYQITGKENRSQLGGDEGLQLVKQVSYTPEFFGRELYMVSVYPDGETFEGAVMVENLNQPGNYNGVKEYSFTAMLQGTSFDWYDPYKGY